MLNKLNNRSILEKFLLIKYLKLRFKYLRILLILSIFTFTNSNLFSRFTNESNRNEIGKFSSTEQVGYLKKYYAEYNDLYKKMENLMNNLYDKAMLQVDNLNLAGEYELAQATEGKITRAIDEATTDLNNMFQSIDQNVVLRGETFNESNAPIEEKINLIQNAKRELLQRLETLEKEILMTIE